MAGNHGQSSKQHLDRFGPESPRSPDAGPHSSPGEQQPSPAISPIARSNNPFLQHPFSTPSSPDLGQLSSPPSAPECLSPSAKLPVPPDGPTSLGKFFDTQKKRTSYDDQECAEISKLLKDSDHEPWSRVPRIYTVLRTIGQLPAIDAFLDLGMNDLYFPFHTSQLPKALPAFYREKFVECQSMVLTKAVNLEGNLKKHAHFRRGEMFPFEVQDTLGRGGFGSVDKVYSHLSDRTYARKRFRRTKGSTQSQSEVQSFMNELAILKRINHQHCVELVASYTDPKYFGLLISPVADHNLSTFYNLAVEANLTSLRSFFGCLAHALHYLHRNKIRHRDIKPGNILVRGDKVYLADFGISLDWENLSRSTTTEDSAKSWVYCAPEVAQYQKRNSSSDIWSLGCVFLEMYTVLKGFTVPSMRESFRQHSDRVRFYENIGPAFEWIKSLQDHGDVRDNEISKWIHDMMDVDPSSRITAESLYESIASVRGKEGEPANPFCGECCSIDIESSSEAESDDDVWAKHFDPDMPTPDTSPPLTDNSLKLVESKGSIMDALGQKIVPAQGLGISKSPDNEVVQKIEDIQLSDTNDDAPSKISDFVNESKALEAEDYLNQKESEVLKDEDYLDRLLQEEADARFAAQEDEDDLNRRLQEEADAKLRKEADARYAAQLQAEEDPRISQVAMLRQGVEAATADENNASFSLSTVRPAPPPYVVEPTPTEVFAEQEQSPSAQQQLPINEKYLQQLRDEITFQPWPWTSIDGRTPKISVESWRTPSAFLESIQSDTAFMEFLSSSDAELYDRFKYAGLHDLSPIIYFFLLNGMNVNTPNWKDHGHERHPGSSPLMWTLAPSWNDPLDPSAQNQIVKILLGFGANPDARLTDGRTPLMRVSAADNVEVMKILLDLGVPDCLDSCARSALWYAASSGRVRAMTTLLDRGSPWLDTVDSKRRPPLIVAAQAGHVNAVKFLHERGVNHQTRSDASNALMSAARNGHHEVIRYLLGIGYYKASMELRCRDAGSEKGMTALHIAASNGHYLVVKELIEHGADFRTRCDEGFNPMYMAAQNGHLKIVQLLVEKGVGVEEGKNFFNGDWRPLHGACESGKTDVVEFLLAKGADPTRRAIGGLFQYGSPGETPLSLAQRGGHADIVALLKWAIASR